MHIVVCVKAVPASTEVKMDPRTHTIVRDGGASVVNPFDTAALELALSCRDAASGADPVCVSVISMGIPATEELLRDCIVRGVRRTGGGGCEGIDAYLLTDRAFAGADTLATTHALACGIRKLGGADVVLCGKMAVDGDTAQIGPELAGALDMACLADVRALESLGASGVVARCGTDEGTATLAAPCPVVLTVAKEAAQLRMPSVFGVLAVEGAVEGVGVGTAGDAMRGGAPLGAVTCWSAVEVGADPSRVGLSGSPTQVVRSFVPERAHEAVVVEGDAPAQAARIIEVWGGEA